MIDRQDIKLLYAGYKVTENDRPGLQFRLINSAFFKKFSTQSESGLGTLLFTKNLGFDSDGNCPEYCYQDSRFHVGENIKLPFSKYIIEVLQITDTNYVIKLSGNL